MKEGHFLNALGEEICPVGCVHRTGLRLDASLTNITIEYLYLRGHAPSNPLGLVSDRDECSREEAERVLAIYDMRRRSGYPNQVIAAREDVKRATGMTVSKLRAWLRAAN